MATNPETRDDEFGDIVVDPAQAECKRALDEMARSGQLPGSVLTHPAASPGTGDEPEAEEDAGHGG
jgi:hypothetical protein